MALSFSEGSIGGDIERVNLTQLEAFYGQPTPADDDGAARRDRLDGVEPPGGADRIEWHRGRRREHRLRQGDAADQPAHLVLLPRRSADGERGRPQRLRRADLGTVLHLPGLQRQGRLDAHVEQRRQHRRVSRDRHEEGRRQLHLPVGTEEKPLVAKKIVVPYKSANGMAQTEFTTYRTHRGPIVRQADGKWVSVRLMEEPMKALIQSYSRTKARNLAEYKKVMDVAHQLVEQHALRRRRRQHRLPPFELHPEARSEVRLDQAGGRLATRRPSGTACCRSTNRRTSSIRRTAGSTTPTTIRSRRPVPATARSRRRFRRMSMPAARTRAACTRSRCSTGKKGLTLDSLITDVALRQLPAGVRDPDPAAAQGARRGAGVESAEGEDRRRDRGAEGLGLSLVGGVGAAVGRDLLRRGSVDARAAPRRARRTSRSTST